MAEIARLVVPGAEGPRTIVLDNLPFRMGRQPENNFRFDEMDVSRRHAEIFQTERGYAVRDLGSSFGTFVNGVKLEKEHQLAHGDHIQLGSVRRPALEFQLVSEEVTRGIQLPTPPPMPEDAKSRAVVTGRSMNMLGQALRALTQGSVLEEVLAIVVDQAIGLSRADRGLVMLRQEDGSLTVHTARDRRGRTIDAARVQRYSRTVPQRAFETGTVQYENEVPEGRHTMEGGIASVLCAPLPAIQTAAGGRAPIGVLYVDSPGFGKLEDPDLHAAFEQLAAEAAVAIENARLVREAQKAAEAERELALAARIQRALLPPGKLVYGPFELAATTEPCRAIGGDFYEYGRMAHERLAFVLGDVSGKGPGAALLAAVILGVLGTHVGGESRPSQVLRQLNETLLVRELAGKFATLAIGTVAPDGAVLLSNAGHNPTYVLRKDGTLDKCDKGGLMVGCFPSLTYDEESVHLQPGDAVILYSDGVTEAVNNAGEMYEEARLEESLRAVAGQSADVILQRIVGDVTAFAGSEAQADDITALVVRLREESAAA